MQALWRGSGAQRVRLGSGLILFAFATTHFINHALGLVSLEAMTAFDGWRTALVRSIPGTAVLVLALAVHVGSALQKLVARRTLKLPPWELWQIGLGLAIPFFLLPHIVNTRISAEWFGINTSYGYELARIWPNLMIDQTLLLLLVWIHGCMGLHYWLRLSPAYVRLSPVLLALAILLPDAALTGVLVQGRGLAAAIADPAQFDALKTATHWPDDAVNDRIVALRLVARLVFYAIVAAVFLGFAVRLWLAKRAKRIPVHYVAGPLVKTEAGPTLLELSRLNNIPHMSVCGGRARCSTCRVLVVGGGNGLCPPTEAETRTLKAIGAGPDVRLACQARPVAGTTIMRLLRVGSGAATLNLLADADYAGVERDLAVLCVDMRGFTALTEDKLPFDVVFILNEFFGSVGRPIYESGGWISNYAGDGLVALFANPAGLPFACRSALLAAAEIDRSLAALNQRLSAELAVPIRVAMGLHAGPHVVGHVGYRDSRTMTVIGLAVNIASRLETLAKSTGVQIAVTREVADHVGLDCRPFRVESTEVRGISQPMPVVLIDHARDLLPRLAPLPAET